MTTRKETAEAKDFREKQEEAMKIMADKDPAFEEGAAATNEMLAARAEELSGDALKASLLLNNPVGSSAAYADPKAEEKVAKERQKLADKD